MTAHREGRAHVNGIEIAYRVDGAGPPLLLIMGYRLSAHAWPVEFIASLAARFTVVQFDNRGTGHSGKPVQGYAIDNLARDACGLLDHLGIERAHVLGYSIGGAIAQEFVRQFPDRVSRLVLCATMCGGLLATYAAPSVQRTMRNLAGLTPQEAARQIWTVTYADGYLAAHRDKAEEQMQREIAHPTPLHAADLQFQAFAEFNCSAALPSFRCATLVITGNEDRLIPPQNTGVLATLIPGARKIVMPGLGHRAIWEDTDLCVSHIANFLEARDASASAGQDLFASFDAMVATWASSFARTTAYMLKAFDGSMSPPLRVPFGDGKPVIILPGLLMPRLFASSLAEWLRAIGYRPRVAQAESTLLEQLAKATDRTGRKAVVLAFDAGATIAMEQREQIDQRVCGFVFVNAVSAMQDQRVQSLSFGPTFAIDLSRMLRAIRIELLGEGACREPETKPKVRSVS